MRERKNRYIQMARNTAVKYGVPPRLFLSMIEHESGWNPQAMSPMGAVGLGQIMPGTARTLKIDPFNPRQNLDGAARHLVSMNHKAGSWRDALRAYNQGLAGSQRGPSYGAAYADAILRGRSKYKRQDGPPARSRGRRPTGVGPSGVTPIERMIFADDPQFLEILGLSRRDNRGQSNDPDMDTQGVKLGEPGVPTRFNGKMLLPGTTWTGDHVTDGLGWGTKTAQDVMADPGTGVGAPESGRVVYFHATGAQGGGSMKFISDSGWEYWLGHIADGVRPGHYKAGERIAVISGDHAAPHLHIDKRKI